MVAPSRQEPVGAQPETLSAGTTRTFPAMCKIKRLDAKSDTAPHAEKVKVDRGQPHFDHAPEYLASVPRPII